MSFSSNKSILHYFRKTLINIRNAIKTILKIELYDFSIKTSERWIKGAEQRPGVVLLRFHNFLICRCRVTSFIIFNATAKQGVWGLHDIYIENKGLCSFIVFKSRYFDLNVSVIELLSLDLKYLITATSFWYKTGIFLLDLR